MAKNKTKQAKFKEVSFTIQKSRFKKLLSNLIMHVPTYEKQSLLNSVKLHYENGVLEMAATDGTTLLKSVLDVEEATPGMVDAILSGVHLEKMKLARAYELTKRSLSFIDTLKIVLKESEALITDTLNQITYTIPYLNGQYPKYNQLIANYSADKHIKIGLNPALFSRLSSLPDHNKHLVMVINKKDPTKQITFNTYQDNDIKYTAIVMPVIIKE